MNWWLVNPLLLTELDYWGETVVWPGFRVHVLFLPGVSRSWFISDLWRLLINFVPVCPTHSSSRVLQLSVCMPHLCYYTGFGFRSYWWASVNCYCLCNTELAYFFAYVVHCIRTVFVVLFILVLQICFVSRCNFSIHFIVHPLFFDICFIMLCSRVYLVVYFQVSAASLLNVVVRGVIFCLILYVEWYLHFSFLHAPDTQ